MLQFVFKQTWYAHSEAHSHKGWTHQMTVTIKWMMIICLQDQKQDAKQPLTCPFKVPRPPPSPSSRSTVSRHSVSTVMASCTNPSTRNLFHFQEVLIDTNSEFTFQYKLQLMFSSRGRILSCWVIVSVLKEVLISWTGIESD